MTPAALADLVGGRWAAGSGPAARGELTRVGAPPAAGPDAIVFATDQASLLKALATTAAVILLPARLPEVAGILDARVLLVRDAKYAFAQAAQALAPPSAGPAVHPRAVVDAGAKVAADVRIGAGAAVEGDVTVGAGSRIDANVTIYAGTTLGCRVIVQAGAVLGGSGFGYVRSPDTGEYLLFPQQGTLVIEDDVEIGANTTIDRGALGATRIGRGTKIDNGVHIGHNCDIGCNVVIAAQAGISGSCIVGDGAVIAGQVGLGDHVTIGPGVILGGAAGVFPHKHVQGPGEMFMGVPAEPLKAYLKGLAKLRRLK